MQRTTPHICSVCGTNFLGWKLQKYCGYKCSALGTYKTKRQCQPVFKLRQCAWCSAKFQARKSQKCCSKQCANDIRASILADPINRLKAQQSDKRKKGLTVFTRRCLLCGNEFQCTTKNQRKIYCSHICGRKVSGITNSTPLDRSTVEALFPLNLTMSENLIRLGVSYHVLTKRMRKWGIRWPKKPPKRRSDGYWNYGSDRNHRAIMEAHLCRPLERGEQVHHIDGDKSNDHIDNLIAIKGTGRHRLAHTSLERCAYVLFKHGLIRFNRETCEYELVDNMCTTFNGQSINQPHNATVRLLV